MTWVPWSSHGMTRKENCVVRGPGHGMTGFSLTFLFCRHPGAGRDPLHRRYLCRIRDGINYLGPVVKPRDDKKGMREPGRGMTSF